MLWVSHFKTWVVVISPSSPEKFTVMLRVSTSIWVFKLAFFVFQPHHGFSFPKFTFSDLTVMSWVFRLELGFFHQRYHLVSRPRFGFPDLIVDFVTSNESYPLQLAVFQDEYEFWFFSSQLWDFRITLTWVFQLYHKFFHFSMNFSNFFCLNLEFSYVSGCFNLNLGFEDLTTTSAISARDFITITWGFIGIVGSFLMS